MVAIHVPLWLLATTCGLPVLALIGFAVRLACLKRRHADDAVACQPFESAGRPETFGFHIHQQILDQHIDTVFTAMSAVLESERVKLKALINHPWVSVPTAQAQGGPVTEKPEDSSQAEESHVGQIPLRERIASLATQGMDSEQIAASLGLSRAEADLAMKMQAGRRGIRGRRMQVVA